MIMFLIVIFAGVMALLIWEVQVVHRFETTPDGSPNPRSAKAILIAVILAIAAATLAYKALVAGHLEQTAALFIGLPALIAIIIVAFGRPRSMTGLLCMVTALALLISGMFLGEGFICILMAAPLFFLVAVLIGGLVDHSRRRKAKQNPTILAILLLLPMSLEGVRPSLSFPREEQVSVESSVPATPRQVETWLAVAPDFSQTLPVYLRLGFPRPTGTAGEGLAVGDCRVIHFAGGEGKPGDLRLCIVERGARRVVFRAISDSSHIAHWMSWQSAEVQWSPEPGGQTRVRWILRYRRSLDPAWYFAPWEHYAVKLAGEYLMRATTHVGGS